MKEKLNAILVCEGKYDKIKLSSIFDATIITTNGFGIFTDKEKLKMLKNLSNNNKIIIITDGDRAGFKIRNYIKNYINKNNVYNVLIPDVYGKERRKTQYSKEKKLGVEGISKSILVKLVQNIVLENNTKKEQDKTTKLDFYEYGLVGRENSYIKRKEFLKKLNLPEKTSTNALIEIVNLLYTKEEIQNMLKESLC